jgi:NitT/TauT family transport system permease protein
MSDMTISTKAMAQPRMSGKPPLLVLRILFLLGCLAFWQIIVEVGLVDQFWISKPSLVVQRIGEILVTPETYSDIAFTMKSLVIGFAISAVAGVATACLFYKYKTLHDVVDPYILALYSTPRLALAPLFIIWFGIGTASKVALIVSICYFIMLLNAYAGLVTVNRRLIDQVRIMGASDWFIFRRVTVPASIPWLLAAARVSLGFALMVAVVGELIISEQGIGLRIAKASGLFDTTGVFAYLVIIAVIGGVLDQALKLAEKKMEAYGTGVKV